MRKLLLSVMMICAYAAVQAQPTPVEIRQLPNHYYIGTRQQLKDEVNCFVIADRKEYEAFFGKTDRPDTPKFSKEIMLVLLMPLSKKDSRMEFKKVDMKAGDFVEAYCALDLNKGKMPYEAYPIVTCAIPRYAGVKKVNFYNDKNMKLLESVPFKN
ncbi:MAG: hypothetical protein EOP51_04685 [Sphingobacteriales bacterium]|nr:MAG: hypothetical protein EOP51_04685 [Sphingobacteriales bacterium]